MHFYHTHSHSALLKLVANTVWLMFLFLYFNVSGLELSDYYLQNFHFYFFPLSFPLWSHYKIILLLKYISGSTAENSVIQVWVSGIPNHCAVQFFHSPSDVLCPSVNGGFRVVMKSCGEKNCKSNKWVMKSKKKSKSESSSSETRKVSFRWNCSQLATSFKQRFWVAKHNRK